MSLWVRDIELTEAQKAALLELNPAYNRQMKGTAVMAARRRSERLQAQDAGRALARRRDPFHAAGCMLYWAEGDKGRHQVRLSNSDPELLRFFVTFLRKYFDVQNEDFRLTCHLFADHLEKQREIERFWLDVLGLGDESLLKSIVNVYSKAQQAKATERSALRNRSRACQSNEHPPEHLRIDPGVRRKSRVRPGSVRT